jgi:hypothetical protein
VFDPSLIGSQTLCSAGLVQLALLDGSEPRGWLASDDGSMEITISSPPASTRTRASRSFMSGVRAERGISVSDYEVVTAQAVKNLGSSIANRSRG